MTTAVVSPAPAGQSPQGHCRRCGKIWIINERQGICRWCGKLATCQTTRATPRHVKSTRRRKPEQANGNGHNGYDQLPEPHLSYYRVAKRFSHKAKAEDTEDLLHDIICTLADAERANGVPLTEPQMYRIASYRQAHYWFKHYSFTNGLDCKHCATAQRRKCKAKYLYPDCPKLIKLDSLNEPIIDSEGNLTERGDLITDDKALDLDAWLDARTFLLGVPQRLLRIAQKRLDGIPLDNAELLYLSKWRKREQKKLL